MGGPCGCERAADIRLVFGPVSLRRPAAGNIFPQIFIIDFLFANVSVGRMKCSNDIHRTVILPICTDSVRARNVRLVFWTVSFYKGRG